MKFYFPDSQDLISPTYDFVHDEYSPLRVRQRDDLYAHEVLDPPPYDGTLVSKAIVDGSAKGAGKYTEPQRQRFYRLGVAQFFRLPEGVATLGDCGAFNYVDEEVPPYTVAEVVDFYEQGKFEAGISVDHVILGYDRGATKKTAKPDWVRRQKISLALAESFMREVGARSSPFQPVGAAQGWSPRSYADSVQQLQKMGYARIALGGMVALKTPDILECLLYIDQVREPSTELHLLGVTRLDSMEQFARHGVTSFDSTSPFRQSFMDDRKNYHAPGGAYVAIRVPQVDGNAALKRRVLSGIVSPKVAVASEREALKRLRSFDSGSGSVDDVLEALANYEQVVGVTTTYIDRYRRTLSDAPWKACPCAICREHGIEIMIFRGTERNKRRGFHNLSVFAARMRSISDSMSEAS